jgi:hypothetical protein
MRTLVIEDEPSRTSERQALVVEAVLVQRVAVDEHHREIAPRGRRVCLVHLDVQLDAVLEADNLRCSSQLAQPQPSSRSLAAPERAPYDDSLRCQTGCGTHRGCYERRAGQTRSVSRVHVCPPT